MIVSSFLLPRKTKKNWGCAEKKKSSEGCQNHKNYDSASIHLLQRERLGIISCFLISDSIIIYLLPNNDIRFRSLKCAFIPSIVRYRNDNTNMFVGRNLVIGTDLWIPKRHLFDPLRQICSQPRKARCSPRTVSDAHREAQVSANEIIDTFLIHSE